MQWTTPTGNAGQLRLTMNEAGSNASGNYSDVTITGEIFIPSGSYHLDANLTVSLSGDVSWATGTWSFDGRGGAHWVTIYSATVRIYHNPNGSRLLNVTFALNSATGTSGVGGPASVNGQMWLTQLTIPPGAPTDLTLTRNDDSLATATWNRHEASNGQATQMNMWRSVNNAPGTLLATFAPTTTMTFGIGPNQKIYAQLAAINSAGNSVSNQSNSIWTTPAAPSNVTATKQPGNSIQVAWVPNVAYTEHQHIIQHGTVSGGVITWDGSILATVPAGSSTYLHSAPPANQVHVYRVWAQTTDVSHLDSTQVQSNTVQLLAPPNPPTLSGVPQFANQAAAFTLYWIHNPVDTTAQTAYEASYSTNGGTTWVSGGKTTSTASQWGSPVNSGTVMWRVRTWGQATSGGSDGTGASSWSNIGTTTFVALPVATITSPANSAVVTQATLKVVLGFSQAQGGSPVQATIRLLEGSTLLETVTTTTLPGTQLATRILDGHTYNLQAFVLDSHGLTSAVVTSTFTVDYTDPMAALITVTYDRKKAVAQLDIEFPATDSGHAPTVAVSITRTIEDSTETVLPKFTVTGTHLSVLDTTPTIHGDNAYRVTTWSSDGAAANTDYTLTTDETRWAYLCSGPDWQMCVRFYGKLVLSVDPNRTQALVPTAGRRWPILLQGTTNTLKYGGAVTVLSNDGSPVKAIVNFLLDAGKVCYRDPSGTRLFGMVDGQLTQWSGSAASLGYSVSRSD